jgi:hypothetical protein
MEYLSVRFEVLMAVSAKAAPSSGRLIRLIALMMEAVRAFETLVNSSQKTAISVFLILECVNVFSVFRR